jgi:hypothetical protein
MAKRFAVGMLKGVVIGLLMALAWLKVMGVAPFDGLLAYLTAAATGALAGFFAGKPFWAKGALVEASLKAAVGTVFASAALYGLRKWVHLDFGSAFGPLGGALGSGVGVTLMTIAGLLAAMFELDNTGAELATDATARVAPNKVRAPDEPAELAEADELGSSIEPRLHRKG